MLMLMFMVVVCASRIVACFSVAVCKSNSDCTEGYFCHNNICSQCVQCTLLLREGSDCVTDFSDCGECLIGYEEVLITDSSNVIKPCKPVRLKEKTNEQECTTDSACPPNNYCHEYLCVECFNCDLLHRLTPAGQCAKELTDCGFCKKGFTEVAVTTDSNIKPCKKQMLTAVNVFSSLDEEPICIVLGLVCVLFFSCVVILQLKKNKEPYKVLKKCLHPVLPSAPPLSTLSLSEHIVKVEEKNAGAVVAVEQIQQAKVFKRPDASYYNSEDEATGNTTCVENNVQDMSVQFQDEISRPMRIFVHNYIELSDGASVTVFPQQQLESRVSVIEGDANQQETEFTEGDMGNVLPDMNQSHEEKL